MTPQAKARQTIDALLAQAGWHICDMADANIHAARGVALREFSLSRGYGSADYLLYIDGRAAVEIEAKKAGSAFTGVCRLSGTSAMWSMRISNVRMHCGNRCCSRHLGCIRRTQPRLDDSALASPDFRHTN